MSDKEEAAAAEAAQDEAESAAGEAASDGGEVDANGEVAPTKTKRKRSWLRAGVSVLAGILVGGVLAELAFHARDDGAFPHLNLYQPDPELGVRLRAGESMRLSFGGNPVTDVRINQSGLRGADLPPPGDNEVVVVGDSQVFGLGVQEDETFSAKLGGLLGDRQVINAGIPTYGPPEYNAMAQKLVAERKAKTVVYVVNFANDLTEANRPNKERHAVWDGWAVRKETAPASVASFPMRETLFRKSHGVYALRRWWYKTSGPVEAFAVPSEGSFKDIGFAAARAAEEHIAARNTRRHLAKLHNTRAGVAEAELRDARDRFMALVNEEQIKGALRAERWYQDYNPLKAAFARPGDIVGNDDTGEYSAPLLATASLILQGAKVRRRVEKELRDRAAADTDKAKKITPVLDAIGSAEARTKKIRQASVPEVRAWSPLMPRLREMKKMCDEAGARLIVVALPLDVQVDPKEWDKYGSERVDMGPARILVDDLLAAADELHVTSVDLTEPLRAAQPGAFLDKDIHMSSKGHEAVAKALAEAVKAPPPVALPKPPAGLPPGRTLPTPLAAMKNRKEVQVRGSTAAGCETYIVDEWLTLRCHDGGQDKAAPIGFRFLKSPLNEHVVYWDRSESSSPALVIQVPLIRGQLVRFDLRWPEQQRPLYVEWGGWWATARAKAGNVDIGMTGWGVGNDEWKKPIDRMPKPSEATCKVVAAAGVKEKCDEIPLMENPACLATYSSDPKQALACLRGELEPDCPRGQVPVGVFQRCAPLCWGAPPKPKPPKTEEEKAAEQKAAGKDAAEASDTPTPKEPAKPKLPKVPCPQGLTCSHYRDAEVCL